MGDTRDRMGAAGVAVAGGFFKIALYVCVAVLIIWIGKVTYQFGYDIFNQHAMSPGEGQEVTVVIKEDATSYDIAKTLKSKGLIDNALVFVVQEKLSNYSGKMRPGTYLLSTAYTHRTGSWESWQGMQSRRELLRDRRGENACIYQFSRYGQYTIS